MGGSGGGGGGWAPSGPAPRCDTLSFTATVNSPQPAALATVNVGDILDVSLSPPPQQTVLVSKQGATVGALTGSKISTLVSCLQNGYRFEAEVVSLNGGICSVDVRPR